MTALGPDALHHLDRIPRLCGNEADRLRRGSADRQSPARRPGGQGDGLVADLHGPRLGLDHLAVNAGLHARRLQLAVDVLQHRIHRARRRPHLGQVDGDRLAARDRLRRHAETHIALEGGDLVGQGAVMNRAGQIFGAVAGDGRRRLALRGRNALNDPHAVELGRGQKVRHFRHARGEAPRQLIGLQSSHIALARPRGQGLQHRQPLIQGEDLAIVARRGALDIEHRVFFVDELASAQRRAQQLRLARLLLGVQAPGRRRLGLGLGRRRGRWQAAETRSGAEKTQQITVVDGRQANLRPSASPATVTNCLTVARNRAPNTSVFRLATAEVRPTMSRVRWILTRLMSLYGLIPRPTRRRPPPLSLGHGAQRRLG